MDDLTLLSYRVLLMEVLNENLREEGRLSKREIQQKVEDLRRQFGNSFSEELSQSKIQERVTQDLVQWIKTPTTGGASVLRKPSNFAVIVGLILLGAVGLYFYLRKKK